MLRITRIIIRDEYRLLNPAGRYSFTTGATSERDPAKAASKEGADVKHRRGM